MSSCFFPPLEKLESLVRFFKKWGITLVLIFVFTFIYQLNYKFIYNTGSSMKPTLQDGSLLLLKKRHYINNSIKRFDVVLVKDEGDYITKRIIGLPGEKIQIINGDIYVNNKMIKDSFSGSKISHKVQDIVRFYVNERIITVPENCVWVIGDARSDSHYGVHKIENILGKVGLLF